METHPVVPLPARRKLVFGYDAMHRRIQKDVWHGTAEGTWALHHKFDFIHELGGWNILAERIGGHQNTFLRTYTWGTDLSGNHIGAGGVGGLLFSKLHTSGPTFAYGYDLNGNVTLLVDTATGQTAATYEYGPFGEPLRQSGDYATLNPFRFSTKYMDDETGWMDYGRRYYVPATGRWPSRDPVEERGGVNQYGFVGNDGVNSIDLLGLAVFAVEGSRYENSSSAVNFTSANSNVNNIIKRNIEELKKFKAKVESLSENDFNKLKAAHLIGLNDTEWTGDKSSYLAKIEHEFESRYKIQVKGWLDDIISQGDEDASLIAEPYDSSHILFHGIRGENKVSYLDKTPDQDQTINYVKMTLRYPGRTSVSSCYTNGNSQALFEIDRNSGTWIFYNQLNGETPGVNIDGNAPESKFCIMFIPIMGKVTEVR